MNAVAKKAENSYPKSLPVRIQTPESLLWEGNALRLSSTNSAGRFDILPQHANIITIIDKQPIEIATANGNRKFVFDKAVLAIKDNNVTIYANISASEIKSG